jgi:hypothetical protein
VRIVGVLKRLGRRDRRVRSHCRMPRSPDPRAHVRITVVRGWTGGQGHECESLVCNFSIRAAHIYAARVSAFRI